MSLSKFNIYDDSRGYLWFAGNTDSTLHHALLSGFLQTMPSWIQTNAINSINSPTYNNIMATINLSNRFRNINRILKENLQNFWHIAIETRNALEIINTHVVKLIPFCSCTIISVQNVFEACTSIVKERTKLKT